MFTSTRYLVSLIVLSILIIGLIPIISGSAVSDTNTGFEPRPQESTNISIFPVKPMVGGVITFTLAGSYQPGSVFTWNFGDGSVQNSSTPTIQYQYAKTGVYQVSVALNSTITAQRMLDLTLMKGDMLVHAGEGIISALIPGMWSHVGMYMGNDTVFESTSEGVHMSNISVWSMPGDTCVAAFRLTGISNETRERIITWALNMNKHPYDLVSIFLYTKQQDCQGSSSSGLCYNYYCSELVWASYSRNGIDLNPQWGAVLPQAVVSGKQQPTQLVGAHIEKIPDAFKHYQSYYDQMLQGKNPPYSTEVGYYPNYELIVIGINDNQTLHLNSTQNSSQPALVELSILDPFGRVLSSDNSTIPNSSIGHIDFDSEGGDTDDLGAIFNAIPGEYLLNISLTNQSSQNEPISIQIGSWNGGQYSWVIPYNATSLDQINRPVPFRIEEKNATRVISIPSRGVAPLNVSFLLLSPTEKSNNTWNFGDGSSVSDQKTTSHTYGCPGNYTVTVVSELNGSVSSINFPVTVEGVSEPMANFTADLRSGTPPLHVHFNDTSACIPVSWNWTFGDGSFSHEQNPVHSYTGIGRYSVTLEITNSTGCQSVVRKHQFISVNSGSIAGPNGMIWISSSPSEAEIYFDQVLIGNTSMKSLGLPAGIHQIMVRKEGYKDWIGNVQISQGGYTYVPKVILQKL